MRILWITNILFPEAQSLIAGPSKLKTSGGWMLGAANALAQQSEVRLYVATVSSQVKKLTRLKGQRITYFLLPYGKGNDKYNASYEPLWLKVHDEIQPDIVHIHGSEYTHGLAYVRACGEKNVVVSIQGLVSIYERYYYSGLSLWQPILCFTLRSFLGRSIFAGRRSFQKRGVLERELLQRVNYIIGRTSWDRAHSWSINPNAHYFHVDETLRTEFYEGKWLYSECKPHSIFLSQASYSVKGLHMVLRAMPLILRHYPDARLIIAGSEITHYNTIKSALQYTDYGRIIRNMINHYKLINSVEFTGPLDADGMKQKYLKANVFVCPSSIENSPNSLGEAQILGVPVIAAYVGGISDMMVGDEKHLYRFEEVEMMAQKICELFDAGGYQPQVNNMRLLAQNRHNPEINCVNLMKVYNNIHGIVV